MPVRAKRPCRQPGCPNLTREGRYCSEHARRHEQAYETSRPSAAARGYDARWRRLRKLVLHRQPVCVDPFGVHGESVVTATEVDHITPLRDGGTNRMENLQALCKSCHSKKTAKEDGRWG